MNIRHNAGRAGVVVLALVATSTVAVLVSPAASASTPPWQQPGNVNHDPNAIGTLSFYNASGVQIFSGTTTGTPIAAYVVGSHTVRAGDTKASLSGYLPQKGSPAGAWSGELLTAASSYPNASAPASISRTLPVYTGTSGDTSLADLITAFPNNSTDADYQGVYEVRLHTSQPATPSLPGYDVADIKVTGTTWQVVYPGRLTATTTKLTASPVSGAKAGGRLTLTATVTPTAAGSVQFKDGNTALGGPVAVSAGKAAKAVSLKKAGTHTFKATFTPTDNTAFAGSVATKSYAVAKAKSTTTATWPATKPVYGKAFTVKAKVSAAGVAPSGTVTLRYGSKKLAFKTLSGGKASLTVAGKALVPGNRKLVLTYGGSSNVAASSISKTLTVVKAKSKTTNTVSPAKVLTSKHAKLTVRVTASGVVPTGTVRIYDGSKRIKAVTLKASNKGKVIVTLPTFTAGKHKIHAGFAGSSLVGASSGSAVTLTVTKK